MTLVEFISIATVPITLLATVSIVFVSVALTTNKNRLETVKAIQSKGFGVKGFSTVASLWALYFHRVFGDRILAKRQLLTIPLYTLVVSGIFFTTWVVYLYIFRNPTHSVAASLPGVFKQSASDFYHKGIIVTLLIDFTTIQLTKMAIRTGFKVGYCSFPFFLVFLTTLAFAYLIFSIAVHYFRVEDMVYLYANLAPNDQVPVIPYEPFVNMASSLKLFYPQTIIHVTTQGWFSTYFMPEPLIFYCAVAAQASLFFITLAYQIATGLEWLKNMSIGLVRNAGTPQVNAYSVIFIVVLWLISVPIIALSILAMLVGE